MHVLGTAGHVDHGKSTLVHALTGMDPDRLKEEKERELTIDLGFAWLTLPGGEEIGIVDVPGHRDFIENMLAGVGGIDAALFVVAADEGVMPQTREHLAILDLLEIQRGLVALTKIDIAPDEEWLRLVEEDVQTLLAGTALEGAPVLRVSGRTGQGLESLAESLSELLEDTPTRPDLGKPRLPIDRAFTLSGFGTVVTGTLLDGSLAAGQEVVLQPSGLQGRIRGLQTHKEDVDSARPGSRVAVNVSGVDAREIQRGEVMGLPGNDRPTAMLDVSVRLLADSPTTIEHNQEVKVFLGAAQRMARVRLLGQKQLVPGEEGWLQLLLPQPLVARRGDRYILRRPSPPLTIGGGQVAEANPKRKYSLSDPEAVDRLEQLLEGDPAGVVLAVLKEEGPASWSRLVGAADLPEGSAREALSELVEGKRVIRLENPTAGEDLWIEVEGWREVTEEASEILDNYHQKYPLRMGMPQEELRSRLGVAASVFAAMLREWKTGRLAAPAGDRVALAEFDVVLTSEQQREVREVTRSLKEDPFAPPSVQEVERSLGSELYYLLLERGKLVQVSEDVVFLREAYEKMVTGIRERMQAGERLSVADVRDMFETSRKYALALMEYLDRAGVTVREGDVRRLA